MRKFYIFIVIAVFSCLIGIPFAIFAASNIEDGIKELSQQISRNMTESGRKKIAVVEFSDLNGNIRALGQFISEELITELFLISPGQFEVVERSQLMKVLDEQELTMSGLLDATAINSVGKILGIDAIVTGSITDLGEKVKINARMIGVDTAKIFAVARASIPNMGMVAKMWGKVITQEQISKTIIPPADKSSSSSVFTNKNSRIYHNHNCPELNTEGFVEFKSPKKAIRAGAMACRRCNPSQQVQERVEVRHGSKTSTPFFQNSFLKITLQSINKSVDKRRVNLVLILENILIEDLWLGLKRRSINLLGNEVVEWHCRKWSGIEAVYGIHSGKRHYSSFSPSSKNIITLIFQSNEESDETSFNISINMYRFIRKSPTQFSIGISDMRITQ